MSERAELGKTPIPGDNPAGEQLVGDDEFEELRQEVSRDPVLGVPVDWVKVSSLGEKLLAERSKDFAVACYLAVALTQQDGLAGLHDGLRILSDLIEHFWENGYPPVPKRVRGRVNALGWLSEKGAPFVAEIEPKLEDAERVSECGQMLEELWKITGERCEEHEIALGDLTAALRELGNRVPQPAAAPAAAPAEAASGEGAEAAPRPAAPAGPAEIRSRGDVESLLLRASSFLRQQDAQDPLAYRLPLIAAFSELTSEPPDEGGQLLIPGPMESQLSGMRSLWSSNDWPGLVDMAESVGRESPLCLDAHRYLSEALVGLGGPYRAAADGVRDEVRSLVGRAPRLLRLQFSDGTPLADGDTQRWLEDDGQGGGGAAAAPVATEIDPEELQTARQEARELARKQDLPGALARLGQTLAADASPRGRFLARLELAELAAGSGRDRVALPMLSELEAQLEEHGLDQWEPQLARRVLELSYQSCRRLAAGEEASPALAGRADQIYARLCRIDPVAAAALD